MYIIARKILSALCAVDAIRECLSTIWSCLHAQSAMHAILAPWKHQIMACTKSENRNTHHHARHSHKINMFSHTMRDAVNDYDGVVPVPVFLYLHPLQASRKGVSSICVAVCARVPNQLATAAMAIIYTRCDTFSFIRAVHASPLPSPLPSKQIVRPRYVARAETTTTTAMTK